MADHTADSHTRPRPHARRVSTLAGDILIADIRKVLDWRERGYPHRQYLPQEDVDMTKFSVSTTVTNCPFKGDTTYYSLETTYNVARSYEQSIEKVKDVARHLVFCA